MLNRAELATFLRTRRDRLTPRDVGLPGTDRRRTPGLRRQEVAQLAGMSIDYYIRLEQARGPRPSRQILAALSRALMLTRDEREYLFRIADESPPEVSCPSREVTPGTRHLLDSLTETPAYVVDTKYDILAWNTMATHFIGDPSGFPEQDRNMIRWMFRRSATDTYWSEPDAMRFTRWTVADLRAAYARYPGNPGIEGLVTELLGVSPQFAAIWAEVEVEARRPLVKRVNHPQVGPLEFECQVLQVPETGQRVIVYCAAPGSLTQQAFSRLAADPELTRPLRVPTSPPRFVCSLGRYNDRNCRRFVVAPAPTAPAPTAPAPTAPAPTALAPPAQAQPRAPRRRRAVVPPHPPALRTTADHSPAPDATAPRRQTPQARLQSAQPPQPRHPPPTPTRSAHSPARPPPGDDA
jgi:transcriptional regulator with XRE-family HTH domain